jgi:CPA2 family monovalent cation:H+ antiporter-2
MIPIGEFSFIIAKLGVDSGSIDDSIFPVTIVVSLTTMLAMPLLLRALPTVVDQRTIIPKKLLNYIFFAGKFVGAGSLMEQSSLEENKKSNFKKYGPKLLVHFVIIVSALALLNYFSSSITSLLENPDVPFFMSSSLLLGILSALIVAYPIFLVIGKTEGVIDKISNAITINYGQNDKQLVNKPIHRVLRNIAFMGLILLLVAIFISFVDWEIDNAKVIISTIGFLVTIPLILDTIFCIRKLAQTHLFDSWLSSDEK